MKVDSSGVPSGQFRATPHNSARTGGEGFFLSRKFGKQGNTWCISCFPNCADGGKDQPSGRRRNCAVLPYLLSVDNTFASPYNQKPLQLGADFVVEALTKFINGHGDAQGGAIISNDLAAMDRIRYEAQVNVGSVISPFNAWQIFRGCVTFPLRMQRINESAGIIVQWLETRAHVTFVSYPGLESSPSHELARKQMPNGCGGVISFGLETDDKTVERFCAALKVVTFAVSLGHDESLIFPQPSYDERIHLYPKAFQKGFLRFSVGLEEPEDIIHDLDQALRAVGL